MTVTNDQATRVDSFPVLETPLGSTASSHEAIPLPVEHDEPRYARDAFWWFLHDAIVHPFTGLLGAVGRLFGSYRLMALAHHIHNASAPSNDAMADYAEAAYRAGCNESPSDPYGSKTPDEQRWEQEAACRAIGKDPKKVHLSDKEVYRIQQQFDLPTWNTQARGGSPPTETSAKAVERNRKARELERSIAARIGAERALRDKETLATFLDCLDHCLEAREKHDLAKRLREHGIDYVPKNYRAKS